MPLEKSPIDGSPMKHVQRCGVEIDVCPTSGGVWLDKGELEKIMDILREAVESDTCGERPGRRSQTREYTATHVMEIFDL